MRRAAPFIVVTIALLFTTLVLTIAYRGGLAKKRTFAGDPLLCGPQSLRIAGNLLGLPWSTNDIAALCTITENGVSIVDLQRAAVSRGISADIRDLTWPELRELGTTCVLHVNSTHFVAANPNETSADGIRIRMYEPDGSAKWISEGDLDGCWSGTALVVTRTEGKKDASPPIEMTYWIDVGAVAPLQQGTFTLPIRNSGPEEVQLRIATRSCNCLNAELQPPTLAAGQNSQLKVTVQHSQKGYFRQRIFLDVVCASGEWQVPVTFAGTAVSYSLFSPRRLWVGQIRQGTSTTKHVIINDPGIQRLHIKDILVEGFDTIGDQVTTNVRLRRIESDIDIRNRAIVARSGNHGDYVLDVEVNATKARSATSLNGRIVVLTSLPEPWNRQSLSVTGSISSSVMARPSVLFLPKAGKAATRITLSETNGDPLRLLVANVKGSSLFRLKHIQKSRSVVELEIVVQEDVAPTDDVQIICQFEGGKVVTIPVVALQDTLM